MQLMWILLGVFFAMITVVGLIEYSTQSGRIFTIATEAAKHVRYLRGVLVIDMVSALVSAIFFFLAFS